MNLPIKLLMIFLALGVQQHSQAAVYCAIDSAQIQFFMNIAETNGEADVIRIPTGSYDILAGGGFTYDALAPVGGDDHDITISGGWTPFLDNPCGLQLSPSAFSTVLDGNDNDRVLTIRVRDNSDIRVEYLSLINGSKDPTANGRGGGLLAGGSSGYTGQITIENNVFIGNEAEFDGALHLDTGDVVRVVNNLFLINHATGNVGVTSLISNEGTGTYFINNTVVLNTTDSVSANATGGVYTFVNGPTQSFIANNILWSNDDLDLRISAANTVYLYNNDIEDQQGVAAVEAMNVSVPPQFAEGLLNFNLAEDSPLRDAGRNPPTIFIPPVPFQNRWSLPDNDLSGDNRMQGIRVDIGALEALPTYLFDDGFEDG